MLRFYVKFIQLTSLRCSLQSIQFVWLKKFFFLIILSSISLVAGMIIWQPILIKYHQPSLLPSQIDDIFIYQDLIFFSWCVPTILSRDVFNAAIKLKKKNSGFLWKWYKNYVNRNTGKAIVLSKMEISHRRRVQRYLQTKLGKREHEKRAETYFFGGYAFSWLYIWSHNDLKNLKFLESSFYGNLQLRFETSSLDDFSTEEEYVEVLWEDFFLTVMPWKYGAVATRIYATIYMLDILNSYRGWRHSRKMPSHGQRTWTNASTASRNNVWVKKMQRLRGRHMYGRIPGDIVNIAMQAERINWAWKINWNREWVNERVAFLGADPKNPRKKYRRRVDLYAAAFLRLITLTRIAKMTKKQKKTVNRAYYTLGYKVGYSINLLRKIKWSRKKKTGKITMQHTDHVILRQRKPRKRRRRAKVMKKVEKKRKVIKHMKKKRAKLRKKRKGNKRATRRRRLK